jgi:uncharacterized protein
MYPRNIDLVQQISKKSFFLLGARSTGKSYWIKHCFNSINSLYINLLDSQILLQLSESPSLLRKMILENGAKHVVIDEIQKLPELLNEIHLLIEENQIHFLLTGSSARKLKKENVNLLGGRASIIHFFPLSYSEIKNFTLEKYLTVGGIPRVYSSEEPLQELDSYVTTYLEQEIKIEARVRKSIFFHRFLKTAALQNGELINYNNISSDAAVPASTVREYYSILEDSLIGYVLEPWTASKKRKAIETSKFYFFDIGIANYICGHNIIPRNSDLWGKNFEQFILMELKTYISYRKKLKKIFFWRNTSKHEVDFLIGEDIAIEVKAASKVQTKYFSGLKALKEENVFKKYYLVSSDPIDRQELGFISCLYWESFLKKLWNDKIF